MFAPALTVCLLTILPAALTGRGQTAYKLTPLELPAELSGLVRAVDINNRGAVLGWVLPSAASESSSTSMA